MLIGCLCVVRLLNATSIGITSMIASGFLVDQLKLPLVAVLASEAFPALGLVYNYEASSPVRIYGNENIMVVRSEIKVAAGVYQGG